MQKTLHAYDLKATHVDTGRSCMLELLISVDADGCPVAGEIEGKRLDLRIVEHLYGRLFDIGRW